MSNRQLRALKTGIKLIEGSDEVRKKKCQQAVKMVLKEKECKMVPEFLISAGSVRGRILFKGPDKDQEQECLAEVEQVLDNFDCFMKPGLVVSDAGIEGRVNYAPKPKASRIIQPEDSKIIH